MRYLSLQELISLHYLLIAQSGGSSGLRDRGALVSAVAQPRLVLVARNCIQISRAKPRLLGHSLIQSHPFVDGNKRVGHAAMEVFLLLNGHEIQRLTALEQT